MHLKEIKLKKSNTEFMIIIILFFYFFVNILKTNMEQMLIHDYQ